MELHKYKNKRYVHVRAPCREKHCHPKFISVVFKVQSLFMTTKVEVHRRADRRDCSWSEKESGAEQISSRNVFESGEVCFLRKWSISDIWEEYIFYHHTQEQRAV